MVPSDMYPVSPAWLLLSRDLGISAANVLRRAGVAADLFAREQPTIRADEMCKMMAALEAEANDPAFAIRMGELLSFEMFDPPIFAAMCSDDLNTALRRLSQYKRLCAPIALHVDIGPEVTRVAPEWTVAPLEPPPLSYAFELTFVMRLARLGTRLPVRARRVVCQHALEPAEKFTAYFGVRPERGDSSFIDFAAEDAAAPFLTAKAGMWSFFEPELRRRLGELEASATTIDRVRSALLELLPSGLASVQAVAGKLGVSARTLQRRLQDEGTSFQRVLDRTREELARHYLGTEMAGAEISFLLGFEDPNSFVRAFHEWTGITPEQLRTQLRAARRPSHGAVR
jgi:AraC-like DNA-binding protein